MVTKIALIGLAEEFDASGIFTFKSSPGGRENVC